MSQAKRENTHYLESVEKSKAVSAIVERKRRTGKPVKPVEQVGESFASSWGRRDGGLSKREGEP